ncbi:MAG: GreA/GreB family elongation factor [Myxococcota bacterium]
MSRAFVKEDGGADALPEVRARGGGLPPGTPNLATPRSAAALREELAALAAERQGLEGADTGLALERKRRLDAEIRALDAYVGTLEVVPVPVAPTRAAFGTRVTLAGDDGERVVAIVGVDEADPAAGAVSFVSPLGRAILGAEVGDEVVVALPAGEEVFEVVAVVALDHG